MALEIKQNRFSQFFRTGKPLLVIEVTGKTVREIKNISVAGG